MLFLLQNNIGASSQPLQDKIKAKLLSADAEKASKMIQESEEQANKLITLLSDD